LIFAGKIKMDPGFRWDDDVMFSLGLEGMSA